MQQMIAHCGLPDFGRTQLFQRTPEQVRSKNAEQDAKKSENCRYARQLPIHRDFARRSPNIAVPTRT